MNPNELKLRKLPGWNDILQEWPAERISRLATLPGMSIPRVAALLGVSVRALKMLSAGEYTPSPTLCRRMEQIEADIKSGMDMAHDILPKRSEMRRRMLLFRSWWLNRDPSRALPEVTVSIWVKWGGGTNQRVEIPAHYLPKLRITEFRGLVDTVRAVVKAMRSVASGYNKLLWREVEEEFWAAYASNTLPEIVERRSRIPAKARAAQKWRPNKNKEGK